MNILILTGKFGMGHWSASQSLRLQLLGAFPSAQVTVEDFFAYAMPDASHALYKGFSLMVTLGSGLYNTYYKCTENMSIKTKLPFEGYFQGSCRSCWRSTGPTRWCVPTPPAPSL